MPAERSLIDVHVHTAALGDTPKLLLGCDFHISYDNLQRLDQNLRNFTINQTQYLLIELDDHFIDRRTRQKWPIDLGGGQVLSKYDAFILGDIDAAALGPANDMLMAAAIEKGKGLLMLGGNASFGRTR